MSTPTRNLEEMLDTKLTELRGYGVKVPDVWTPAELMEFLQRHAKLSPNKVPGSGLVQAAVIEAHQNTPPGRGHHVAARKAASEVLGREVSERVYYKSIQSSGDDLNARMATTSARGAAIVLGKMYPDLKPR